MPEILPEPRFGIVVRNSYQPEIQMLVLGTRPEAAWSARAVLLAAGKSHWAREGEGAVVSINWPPGSQSLWHVLEDIDAP